MKTPQGKRDSVGGQEGALQFSPLNRAVQVGLIEKVKLKPRLKAGVGNVQPTGHKRALKSFGLAL